MTIDCRHDVFVTDDGIVPTCDLCNGPQRTEGDDWNRETGNHRSCEAQATVGQPLVIIGVGGGLVQWDVRKPGTGEPLLYVLDYDREGQSGDELMDFADEIADAREALAARRDPADAGTLANMDESIDEYREMALDDETAGRYR